MQLSPGISSVTRDIHPGWEPILRRCRDPPDIASEFQLYRDLEAPLSPEILHPFHFCPVGAIARITCGRFPIQIADLTLNDLILRLVRSAVTTDRDSLNLLLVGLPVSAQTLNG